MFFLLFPTIQTSFSISSGGSDVNSSVLSIPTTVFSTNDALSGLFSIVPLLISVTVILIIVSSLMKILTSGGGYYSEEDEDEDDEEEVEPANTPKETIIIKNKETSKKPQIGDVAKDDF